jgi:hypothetical protein
LYGYFVNFVNFTCRARASRSVKHVQVWSPHSNVKMPEAGMVDLSSSDTEESLVLLSLSPAHGYHSPLSNLQSSSNSDLFRDWLEANDMVASVYIALIADGSSSRASTIDSLHDGRKSCAGIWSARRSRSWAASSMNPRRQKTTLTNAPQ